MEGREKMEIREKMLYEASVSGNIDSLNELIKEDRLIIARASVTCFDETPLHIAAMLGHHDFAIAILNHNPSLAVAVDSHSRSPLHLASSNGYVEIVKTLLAVNSDACLVRDEDGRTPLHLAVMKGFVDVMDELIRARPETIRCNLDQGETLLHLAVKYNRLGALKLLLVKYNRLGALKLLLVKYKGGDDDFVNAKDEDGNTILHLATILKQKETVKYLLTTTGVKVNAINGNGFTALDIIRHTSRDFKGMEKIRDYLKDAKRLKARYIPAPAPAPALPTHQDQVINIESETMAAGDSKEAASPKGKKGKIHKRFKKHDKWLTKNREALMVAATVIAAMAYQAGLNPPGGVWGDDTSMPIEEHVKMEMQQFPAGTSIMAVKYPDGYPEFWRYNTTSFIASLSIIFLLVSGLPIKRRIFMAILMGMMWLTVTCMALTYLKAMEALTPHHQRNVITKVVGESIFCWIGLVAIVITGHFTCFFVNLADKFKKRQKKNTKNGNASSSTSESSSNSSSRSTSP